MTHSARPTLPPLHTLDLPRGDVQTTMPSKPAHCHQRRRPLSPPSTASPRTPSPPAPFLRPRTNTPAPTSTTPFPARKVRLVPTSFENADAVVLVPPPSAPSAPPPQPLLLVGPALERLRHPQRQLAKGARIHPYRIARGPSDRRPLTGPSHTKT